MKKVLFLFIGFLLVYNSTWGQRIELPSFYDKPMQTGSNKNNVIPFLGISVAIPLFKNYKKPREVNQIVRPFATRPNIFPKYSPDPSTYYYEDGPIAWEHTGEEVTIYVPRNYYGGYSPGDNGGSNPGGDITVEVAGPPDSGGSSGPSSNEPPKPLIKSRKVAKNFCENNNTIFKRMYDYQTQRDKEQACFLTDKGIFWLDDIDNTHGSFSVGLLSSYGTNANGTKYFYVNGEVATIQAIIHTHPSSGDKSGPGLSEADLNLSSFFKVPIYAIHTSGIWKGMPNGTQSIANYNMETSFDCNLANNLFDYN